MSSASAGLAYLAEHTTRYVEAGLQGAPNTARAHAGDWRRFTEWCTEYGLVVLPASVDTLASFVTYMAEAGKKVSAIQRLARAEGWCLAQVAGAGKGHELAALPDSWGYLIGVEVLLRISWRAV